MADPAGKQGPELFTRLVTAVILLPLLGLVYYGGPLAVMVYLAVTVLMGLEILTVKGEPLLSGRGLMLIIAILLPGATLAAGSLSGLEVSPLISILAGGILLLALDRSLINLGLATAVMLMSFCFISLTLDHHQEWLLLMVAAVIAADSTAFFGGKFFGGPKLAPKISPSKTWSGAICGLVGGGIVAGALAPVIGISTQAGVIMGVLIADFSIGGDLFESLFKRRHNVKDAGRILPGHGGILDRCDGYLLSAPLVYAVVTFGGIDG